MFSKDSGKKSALVASWLGWKIFSLLGKSPRTLAGLAILILIASGLDIAVPFLARGMIDRILLAIEAHGGAATGVLRTLLVSGAAIFAATLVNRILRSLYNYRLVRAVTKAEDEIKTAAFANFLVQDTEHQNRVNTGEVVGALDRGGLAIYVVLNEVLGQNLVPPLLIVTGVFASLLLKNPWIALLVFAPLPAYVLAIHRCGPRMRALEQQVSRAFEAVSKESFDIASNVRVVKKFGREREEARAQRRLLSFARAKHYAAERLWALVENAQTLIVAAGRVGVITLGGYFAVTRRCTVGDYVLFIAMQDMVYGPISQLSIIVPKLRRNLSRAERLFEILGQKRRLLDAPGARELRTVRRSVEFRGVSFRHEGSARWALENVNFTVEAGSTVALIGASGAGKSTLLNLLQRLYDPQHGKILIDGVDIRDVTQASLRAQISVVPQEVELFSRSIRENIAYGLDHVRQDEVEQAARLAQAHDFIQRRGAGYDTQVGERGAKLSGGERQRIGIARAILRDPAILILDEATSHLDNESERLIQLALEEAAAGRTSFIIAHRLSTVRNADLVVLLAGGGIEAAGTHEQLWRSSAAYRRLHGLHLAERPKPDSEDDPAEKVNRWTCAAND